MVEYCLLGVPATAQSVRGKDIACRSERPEVVEAEALVGDGKYNDARRPEQRCRAVQKSYQIGRVLDYMTSDKCIKGTVELGWHSPTERAIAPNKIHVFNPIYVNTRLTAVLIDQFRPRGSIDGFGIPALDLGGDRTETRADLNDRGSSIDWPAKDLYAGSAKAPTFFMTVGEVMLYRVNPRLGYVFIYYQIYLWIKFSRQRGSVPWRLRRLVMLLFRNHSNSSVDTHPRRLSLQ
jgi:hypothetical protein